jgi:hypothetical protein
MRHFRQNSTEQCDDPGTFRDHQTLREKPSRSGPRSVTVSVPQTGGADNRCRQHPTWAVLAAISTSR